MLTSLWIKNFTIVAELALDFTIGMSAFTGETGAGKSIMIDALSLALGGRADAAVIRPGSNRCEIQAHFSYAPDSAPFQWLQAHDLLEDECSVFLRRVITEEGRSKAYINGVPFPLQKIKELSAYLVHIYGQHAHQNLLTHSTHREQLDAYAAHTSLCAEVAACYKHCVALEEEQQALAAYDPKHCADISLQLAELQELAPLAGEIDSLHAEHQNLHHAKDYLEQTEMLEDILQGEDQPNIRHHLHQATQLLARLPQDNATIQSAQNLLANAIILCNEAHDDIMDFVRHIQLDPERLQALETRMSALHHVARKYHIDVHQLAAYQQTLASKLEEYTEVETRRHRLLGAYHSAQKAYQEASLRLRLSRQTHALRLGAEITAYFCQLGMPHGVLQVDISPVDNPQAHGLDKVTYKVSTNPGMAPDLLSNIASGGELSRIGLAIQMIAAQQSAVPTLLFDEVDVGIGGATAAMVGRLLRRLGEHLQVFCVTHQAQVAASAHHHFAVKKHTIADQTFSEITVLTAEKKVEEIARMLGGVTITPQTRAHAEELVSSQA